MLAPPRLEQALGHNYYKEWLSGDREEWSGVLTLWHVVEFKTAQGQRHLVSRKASRRSTSARIRACISRCWGYRPRRYRRGFRAGSGRISGPSRRGWCGAEQLAPLGIALPAFRGNLAPLRAEGAAVCRAVPVQRVLSSGQHRAHIQELGLSWPSDAATLSDTLQQAMDARSHRPGTARCARPPYRRRDWG